MDFFGFDPLEILKEGWGKAIDWLTGKLNWLSDKLDGFLNMLDSGKNKNAAASKASVPLAATPALNPPPLTTSNRENVTISNANTFNITISPGQDSKAIAAELARQMERMQNAAAGSSLSDLQS